MGEIVVALNTYDKETAINWVSRFRERVKIFKIGLPLFSRYGPQIVEEIKKYGVDIFLDMKLHDIPSVVRDSIQALKSLDVKYVTIHITGGSSMISEALLAAEGEIEIIGVTILTSIDNQMLSELMGKDMKVKNTVSNLVDMFVKLGGKNIVLSGHEAKLVKDKFPDVKVFVPGIRFSDDEKGDQARVVTPKFARENGFDFIVVGRSVTHAKDPDKALDRLVKEFYGT